MVRSESMILLAVTLCAAASCTGSDDILAAADTLELRLGGQVEPLSQALRRPPPGVKVPLVQTDPAPVDPPVKPQPSPVEPEPEVDPLPDPPRQLPVDPQPKPTPRPEPKPTHRTFTLAAGQTLYNLCRVHLGDGNRWKEVAALNGWTEADVKELPAGQAVRLPAR